MLYAFVPLVMGFADWGWAIWETVASVFWVGFTLMLDIWSGRKVLYYTVGVPAVILTITYGITYLRIITGHAS